MISRAPSVLVVDDEEAVSESCQTILNGAGFRTTTSRSRLDALREVDQTAYDVVLVDLEMPDLNGLSLLDQMKWKQPWIQVIVLVGHTSIEDVKAAVRSGASDFIPKPLSPSAVLQVVREALEQKEWTMRAASLEREEDEAVEAENECWLEYEGEGEVSVGLDPKFAEAIGNPIYVELPIEGGQVERDETLFRILAEDGRIHEVSSPIAGRVARVNDALLGDADALRRGGWVVRLGAARPKGSGTVQIK